MRGKVGSVLGDSAVLRITPAHAGKRAGQNTGGCASRDHPCVCGEEGVKRARRKLKLGSPPRVRGKVLDSRTATDIARITPAHAGKRQS